MKKLAKRVANHKGMLIISGAIGLVLSYSLGTRAIDTGSWWEYFGCFVFLGMGARLLIRAFKK